MTGNGGRLGVTVMPEYIQSEGIDAVLDRLVGQLGARVLVTSPYLAEPTTEDRGGREPPIDAGAGSVRLLDRPLWGKHALYLRTEPAFTPDLSVYRASPYQPPEPGPLTASQGHLLTDFIEAAHARGAEVHFQVMAAIPPCYRVQFGGPVPDDMPMLPDGRPLPKRVDNNASLAAPGLRAYLRAMITDLLTQFPGVDGLKFDWPEYPPYDFLSLLADYNPLVAPVAEAAGIGFARLRRDMTAFQARLGNGQVPAGVFAAPVHDRAVEARLIEAFPVLADHLRLRRAVVLDYARFLRGCIDGAGGKVMTLQGFPPPWNRLSGFDPGALQGHADRLAIKFYTMHWPMMLANYAQNLRSIAPFAEPRLAETLGAIFYGADWRSRPLDQIRYPEPSEPHGVTEAMIAGKYAEAAKGLERPLIAMAHSYGPAPDVALRFMAAWRVSGGNVEINRYAYLSDAKIALLAEHLAEAGQR